MSADAKKPEDSCVATDAPTNTEQHTYLVALISEYANCNFDAGEWTEESKESYEAVNERCHEAKRKLLAEIAKLRLSAERGAQLDACFLELEELLARVASQGSAQTVITDEMIEAGHEEMAKQGIALDHESPAIQVRLVYQAMHTVAPRVSPLRDAKPKACENGCPPQTVCDYCQGVGGSNPPAYERYETLTPEEIADGIEEYRRKGQPVPVSPSSWDTIVAVLRRVPTSAIYYANPKQVPNRGEAVNVAHNYIDGLAPGAGYHLTPKGIRMLADAVILMDAWISEVTKPGGRLSTAADIPAIEAIKKKVYIAYYDCAVNSRMRNMLSEVIADLNAAQSLTSATATIPFGLERAAKFCEEEAKKWAREAENYTRDTPGWIAHNDRSIQCGALALAIREIPWRDAQASATDSTSREKP